MSLSLAYLGLAIESPLTMPSALNFRPPTWPPPCDFPIVIDANGQVVSRYGDDVWNFRPWAKKPVIINFNQGWPRKGTPNINHENTDLLRQVVAWWLYGPSAVRSPITLRQRFYDIRPLFSLCSSQSILASELKRFPAVVDMFLSRFPSAAAINILSLLHALYEQRDQIGFTLLDKKGLIRLEAMIPDREARQTPYIPPRIWVYQVNRLRAFLDDFHLHRKRIESCYHFCLEAYAKNAGSLGEACRVGRNRTSGPFWSHNEYTGARTGYIYYGPFVQTAHRFGIAELLERWTRSKKESGVSTEISVRSLSMYFSMVGYVGMAYLLNFSLMRIAEGWSLRADCLEIENDERFGVFYLLRGRTTKTVKDDDARWPTSPSVQIAIDAMSCIARLRMICAEANPDVPSTFEEIYNPYLVVRPYEPWGPCGADELKESLSVRAQPLTYLQMFNKSFPCIFDEKELRITPDDLKTARLVNPSLNSEKFEAGNIWPLAWHQLRRTGAVNMQASGLVSDSSLQYLLKHASRSMALYYGQGYSRVRLDNNALTVYIRTMYELLGKDIEHLLSDRFVSPHGEMRKAEILKIVDQKENRKLLELAKLGKISWRETLLGGCTKRGPCPYGGVDNVARCGGGDGRPPCSDVLYDRDRESELYQFSSVLVSRLTDAPVDSPYRQALEAQLRAVENALDAIKSS
ncbi:hypothetical protein [Chromobacterium sp. Beijing]|uniref:hypothetical protein n=1 Tax=Chromobacterium sp. Beijing TaxID=2735795 RepID=UPI001F1C9793|nr:hypothetical protein [Chromobacterium sp. Beijing]UJB33420.1 hypothetical protein HQN78_21530 [Chromobacterium sp. Beijing]